MTKLFEELHLRKEECSCSRKDNCIRIEHTFVVYFHKVASKERCFGSHYAH